MKLKIAQKVKLERIVKRGHGSVQFSDLSNQESLLHAGTAQVTITTETAGPDHHHYLLVIGGKLTAPLLIPLVVNQRH